MLRRGKLQHLMYQSNPENTQCQNSSETEFALTKKLMDLRPFASSSSPCPRSPPCSVSPCNSPSSQSWRARCMCPGRTWPPPPPPSWSGIPSPSSSHPFSDTPGNIWVGFPHPASHCRKACSDAEFVSICQTCLRFCICQIQPKWLQILRRQYCLSHWISVTTAIKSSPFQ